MRVVPKEEIGPQIYAEVDKGKRLVIQTISADGRFHCVYINRETWRNLVRFALIAEVNE